MNDSQANTSTISSVPLLDVSRGNGPLLDEIKVAIDEICHSGWFVGGPNCAALEQSIAELCQTEHAIGCASGSDAVLLSLMACGVSPGDEVIVPSFTFFATASAVWRLGAKPVFVDIDPTTFNIDPKLIEDALTPATKVIMPVHLFGQCADMDAICDIAQRHGVTVIEDAAQAIGASYGGRGAGSIGAIGCFSFYPTKNLGAFGDAGVLTTSDTELADRLRLLANHGMRPRYNHSIVGINSRLDAIQAAVLNIKAKHLSTWAAGRRDNAARYQQLFAAMGVNGVEVPQTDVMEEHVWNQFTVRVSDGRRDALRKHLADNGVGTEIYYPIPLHQQPCFATDGRAICLPETERAAAEVLSLPIFPELTPEELQYVVERIAEFCGVSTDETTLHRKAS